MDNVFLGNLGAATFKTDDTVVGESDDRPATFWISHPTNYFERNVAAGSAGSGYWFELERRGPRANLYPDLDPKHEPLLSFQDNVAHSNYEDGVRTYPNHGYQPKGQMQKFEGLKIFRNRHTGM